MHRPAVGVGYRGGREADELLVVLLQGHPDDHEIVQALGLMSRCLPSSQDARPDDSAHHCEANAAGEQSDQGGPYGGSRANPLFPMWIACGFSWTGHVQPDPVTSGIEDSSTGPIENIIQRLVDIV